MKTFTGVVWEIPRWKAPPKISVQVTSEEQSASGDSSKENKDNSQLESEKSVKSNAGGDVEMGNTPTANIPSPPTSSLTAAPTSADDTPTAVAEATADTTVAVSA